MSDTGRRYSPEFRRQMIDLVRHGRRPEELSREFEPSAQAIRNWVAGADREQGRTPETFAALQMQLKGAREEIHRLREERAILREMLRMAAAWFARDRPEDAEDESPLPWRIPE